jgi:hypothetical protein
VNDRPFEYALDILKGAKIGDTIRFRLLRQAVATDGFDVAVIKTEKGYGIKLAQENDADGAPFGVYISGFWNLTSRWALRHEYRTAGDSPS